MDIEVLRRAPLFATLDDEAFRLLTDELTEVDLSRGASVFREGDQGDQHAVGRRTAEAIGEVQQGLGDAARGVGEDQVGEGIVGAAQAAG